LADCDKNKMCLVNSSLTAKNDDFSQNMKETSFLLLL